MHLKVVGARQKRSPLPDESSKMKAMTVDAAVKAFRAGKPNVALTGLLAVWRKTRAPEVAAAIAAVGQELDAARGPIAGKRAARVAAWKKVNQQGDAADVGRLLHGLDGLRVEEAEPLLAAVRKWPADPRTWDALFGLLEAPPVGLRGRNAAPHWQRVLEILEAIGEPRTRARRLALVKTLRAGGDVDQSRHLPDTTVTMLECLRAVKAGRAPAPKPLSPPEQALLAQLRPAPRGDLGALYAKVYAAPHDDGARQILADALLESGDARGELINLQLLPKPDAAQKKRAKQLLDAQGRKWLGPLEPAVLKSGFAYRRGFPAAAKVSTNQKSVIHAVTGRPEWSTFEELDVESWPPQSRQQFVSQPLPALKRVYGLENCSELPDRDVAWEEVSFRYLLKEHVDALCKVTSLPKLKVLQLHHVYDGPHPKFWKSPIARTITRLDGGFDVEGFVHQAPPNLVELRSWMLLVRKTPKGIEGEMTLKFQTGSVDSYGDWFEAAKDALCVLRIRGATDPEVKKGFERRFKGVPIEWR